MQSFLVFSLAASLGAMGELAGHERRGSLIWPARSAIIGLLGAALGIRRDGDFSALDRLEVDIAIFETGAPLRDYHTVETVPSAAVKMPNSRPQALLAAASGKTNTTITLRDYRTGVFYGVAIRGEELEELKTALAKPHFTLYFGRKSCPLAAPAGARIVEAETAEAALSEVSVPLWHQRAEGARAKILVSADPAGEVIHDIPLNRKLWHFAQRRVALRPVEIVAGGKA
ncbi:type I-E CRISPR-associated protein Cas5/CasD [Pseudochrobactrum sp. HB0163]|uniref:type I-E CRISPR-associated protein Cas5/CasD n=1 Tax=Pseudochrobactrum sp. HB0163 TaxID=3450708 RepID=UPI003F6DA5B9